MDTLTQIIIILVILFMTLLIGGLWIQNKSRSSFGSKKNTKESFGSEKSVKDHLSEIYSQFNNRFVTAPGNPLPGVDCVYVICMPQREEYIKNEMKKLGVSVCYFKAITPNDIKGYYDILSYTNKIGSSIYKRYTRFPVLLSQIMCFMDSLAKGYKTIIVFEDDLVVNVTLETLIESISEFNNSKFMAFYMGYCFVNCRQKFKNEYRYIAEIPDHSAICCHAMCMKTALLENLIEYCFPMKRASDEMYREYYIKNNIPICIPKTAYFSQNRKTLDSLNESMEDLELFKTCSI